MIIDSAGRIVTTEQCLLHPNRNPAVEGRHRVRPAGLSGCREVVWLDRGLLEDRDTDGHVDLMPPYRSGSLLLQSARPANPITSSMAENRERAERAGLDVIDFAPLPEARSRAE